MELSLSILISLFHDLFAAIWIGGIVVYFTVISFSIKDSIEDNEKSIVFNNKIIDNFGFIQFLTVILVLGTGIIFEDGISFLLGEGRYAKVLGLKVLSMILLIILMIPSMAIKNLKYRLIMGILHSATAVYVIYLSLELKYFRNGVNYNSDIYFWASVHDLFTFIWMGGMIAYSFTLLITARSTFEWGRERRVVMMVVRRNMAILALTSMIMLVISGLFLFPSTINEIGQYFFNIETSYSLIFQFKIISSIILLVLVMIKFFKVDHIKLPKIKRKWILIISTANIILIITIMCLSIFMRYIRY